MSAVHEEALATLFTEARTHNVFRPDPVDPALLRRIYELARMAPTGGNTQPLRVLYVTTPAAKEKLLAAMAPGNVDKTRQAPVNAVLAYDSKFYEQIPKLFPARPEMRDAFAKMPEEARVAAALQNTNMQAGYFILAARALGLDCGPMGGFDKAKVDAAFFADGDWRSVVVINLGYGDHAKLHPRNPRLAFEEAVRVV
jgi:3-hydroxypropanoate dehydrogenase